MSSNLTPLQQPLHAAADSNDAPHFLQGPALTFKLPIPVLDTKQFPQYNATDSDPQRQPSSHRMRQQLQPPSKAGDSARPIVSRWNAAQGDEDTTTGGEEEEEGEGCMQQPQEPQLPLAYARAARVEDDEDDEEDGDDDAREEIELPLVFTNTVPAPAPSSSDSLPPSLPPSPMPVHRLLGLSAAPGSELNSAREKLLMAANQAHATSSYPNSPHLLQATPSRRSPLLTALQGAPLTLDAQGCGGSTIATGLAEDKFRLPPFRATNNVQAARGSTDGVHRPSAAATAPASPSGTPRTLQACQRPAPFGSVSTPDSPASDVRSINDPERALALLLSPASPLASPANHGLASSGPRAGYLRVQAPGTVSAPLSASARSSGTFASHFSLGQSASPRTQELGVAVLDARPSLLPGTYGQLMRVDMMAPDLAPTELSASDGVPVTPMLHHSRALITRDEMGVDHLMQDSVTPAPPSLSRPVNGHPSPSSSPSLQQQQQSQGDRHSPNKGTRGPVQGARMLPEEIAAKKLMFHASMSSNPVGGTLPINSPGSLAIVAAAAAEAAGLGLSLPHPHPHPSGPSPSQSKPQSQASTARVGNHPGDFAFGGAAAAAGPHGQYTRAVPMLTMADSPGGLSRGPSTGASSGDGNSGTVSSSIATTRRATFGRRAAAAAISTAFTFSPSSASVVDGSDSASSAGTPLLHPHPSKQSHVLARSTSTVAGMVHSSSAMTRLSRRSTATAAMGLFSPVAQQPQQTMQHLLHPEMQQPYSVTPTAKQASPEQHSVSQHRRSLTEGMFEGGTPVGVSASPSPSPFGPVGVVNRRRTPSPSPRPLDGSGGSGPGVSHSQTRTAHQMVAEAFERVESRYPGQSANNAERRATSNAKRFSFPLQPTQAQRP
jgi:hypothetical protein